MRLRGLDAFLPAETIPDPRQSVTGFFRKGHLVPHLPHDSQSVGIYRHDVRSAELSHVDGREKLSAGFVPVLLRHPILVFGSLAVYRRNFSGRGASGSVLAGKIIETRHVQLNQDRVRPRMLDYESDRLRQIEDVSRSDYRYHDGSG